MEKEAQVKLITSIIVALVILVIILFSFSSFTKLQKKAADVEIINLKTSIETRILQQSVKSRGSLVNVSFAVPGYVEDICFFDPNLDYDRFRNPEIVGLFSNDKKSNFFITTEDGFFSYKLNRLQLDKNPLCAKIINNKIALNFVSAGQTTQIATKEELEDVKCVSVFENGDPKNKIDITFLGYGFSDIDTYNNEINRYVNNIMLSFEPFKEFKDRFNFYRIDENNIECQIGSFIQCDRFEIKLAASDCPSDYIILLVDRNFISDLVRPVRSSAISNIVKVNTADKPFVMVHEFGHSFGDLADEYVDLSYYNSVDFFVDDYVNCDSTPCPTWAGVEDTSCYRGCSLNQYFRPTETSVMRSLSSTTFGPVNERELIRRMLFYE